MVAGEHFQFLGKGKQSQTNLCVWNCPSKFAYHSYYVSCFSLKWEWTKKLGQMHRHVWSFSIFLLSCFKNDLNIIASINTINNNLSKVNFKSTVSHLLLWSKAICWMKINIPVKISLHFLYYLLLLLSPRWYKEWDNNIGRLKRLPDLTKNSHYLFSLFFLS